MHFTKDACFRHCIAHFLEKLSNGARPHVHVVLQDSKLARTESLLQRDWIFNTLTTLYDLLTEHTKTFWLFYPLVVVATRLLDAMDFVVGGALRGGRTCTWSAQL